MLFRSPLKTTAMIAAMLAWGCTPAPVHDPFAQTGALLALSGGEAGAGAACHTCHGLHGEGDGAHSPRIAGLEAGYIVRQLGFFADGQRRHPQMSRIAGRLDLQDRAAVAEYYADMALPVPSVGRPGDAPQPYCGNPGVVRLYHSGDPQRDLAPCASCHGAAAQGGGPGNPALAGQPAPYLARQIRDWREGRRRGDPLRIMQEVSGKLEEGEISGLADYIAHGPEPTDRRGFPAECR